MPNSEHLRILNAGVETWNAWRQSFPGDKPDLREGNLSGMTLRGINFRDADLTGAALLSADLRDAVLQGAQLAYANLSFAFLVSADLNSSDLSAANLTSTLMSHANLRGARLTNAILDTALLNNADFASADLRGTILKQSLLTSAILTEALFHDTVFGQAFIRDAVGLTECCHHGPSFLDLMTLAQNWPLPIQFLRGVGLSEVFIQHLPRLMSEPQRYRSCFISYASEDQEFAYRLHADLQQRGVRCWFAPENLKTGDKLDQTIDGAIRSNDKLLLILSRYSLSSKWVESEVATAFAEEKAKACTVLFPVRLDDAVGNEDHYWALKLRRERHIGDFRDWRDEKSYERSLDRLLRDLAVEGDSSDAASDTIRRKFLESATAACNREIESGDLRKGRSALDKYLQELPGGAVAVEHAAKLLCNWSLICRASDRDVDAHDALMQLTELAERHSGNVIVCESIVRSCVDLCTRAEQARSTQLAGEYLEKARAAYEACGRDPEVRGALSVALYNSVLLRDQAGDSDAAEAALDNLRALERDDGNDGQTATNLAESLLNRLVRAEEIGAMSQVDSLLDELRKLARRHPENFDVARQYARSLCNRCLDAEAAKDWRLSIQLRRELLVLTQAAPIIDADLRREGWCPPYGLTTRLCG